MGDHQIGNPTQERLANGLGWFSIGLGAAELLAPGGVARLIGVDDGPGTRKLLRAYGIREMAAGFGILAQQRPTGWVWARVAGDLLDLGTLGTAFTSEEHDRARLTAATAAVAGVTVLDVLCGTLLTRDETVESLTGPVKVSKATIINRPAAELYGYWHDFANLPNFMEHLESVQVNGRRSHWKSQGPMGMAFEWDADTTIDQPDSHIQWRSVEGSEIRNSGSVRFERATGGRGTVVRVELEYDPPGGKAGAAFAKLFGSEPGQQLEHDLRVFKMIMETGEVVKSDASIHRGMHAAQPPETVPSPA